MSQHKFTFQIPGNEWFQTFLQNIVSGDSGKPNSSEWLHQELFSLMDFMFEKFVLQRPVISETSEESSDGVGPFVFPIEIYHRHWNTETATGRVSLERMINGHLGCNEDNFSFSFTNQEKLLKLNCYLFLSNEVKVEIEAFSNNEAERIDSEIRRRLARDE